MSSAQKTLYGILAFLPFLLLIYMIVSIFAAVAEIIPENIHDEPNPKEIFNAFLPMFFGILFMSLLGLTQIIVYIVHAVNNKDVQSNERIMWVLLFIFFGYISAPIYFFTRIVNDKPKDDAIPKM